METRSQGGMSSAYLAACSFLVHHSPFQAEWGPTVTFLHHFSLYTFLQKFSTLQSIVQAWGQTSTHNLMP
jgi:hypothetical protein